MSAIAEDIKNAVTMKQVAELYGIRVDRAGFARCPFHHEKTASFKVYAGDRGYHCFGCGKSGDVIGFVQEMDGCSFMEACEKLNREFALGLPIGQKMSRRAQEEASRRAYVRRRERRAAQMAAEAAETAFWKAYDAWLGNLSIIEKKAPKTEAEGFSDEWVQAVHKAAILEYELELAEIKRYEQQKR